MIERIQQLLKAKNLTPSQFADEIGIQRSGMSHLLSGRNKPSLEFVYKVLRRYPDINAEWLIKGNSPGEADSYLEELPSDSTQPEIPLFDEPVQSTAPAQKKTGAKESFAPAKSVEKIVIFYRDKTFREYTPEV
jgi:transcriptional regulator with XRE-family HTH domain